MFMKQLIVLIFACICLPFTFKAQTAGFPLPDVPSILVTPTDRANYLAVHYWDRFDFKDNSLTSKSEITEQGFANFVSIMPYVTEKKEAFAALAKGMTENARMQEYMLEVAERYLFDNFSPVYDEELYLLFIEEVLKQPKYSLAQRERLRYQQGVVKKNRINTVATDFAFMHRNGKRMNLKEVKADYVLLYLNDPECNACKEIKESLEASEVINRWKNGGRMKVLSICIEGETAGWKNIPAPEDWIDGCDRQRILLEEDLYDLRNLPAIYLLDAGKRIILKNATLPRLEQMLKQMK